MKNNFISFYFIFVFVFYLCFVINVFNYLFITLFRSKENPSTFMANMLYAISILYKTKLPIVLALTKNDVVFSVLYLLLFICLF